MNTLFVRACALLFFLVTAMALHADPLVSVPQIINYQGRVAVGGVNFNGTGQFKFALVNGMGNITRWSNDGTSTAGSEPTAAVTLTVTNGLYSVLLGDSDTLNNMTTIPASVFTDNDSRLRVWFDDGTHGSQLLIPDQRIAAAPYAMVAGTVANAVPHFQVFNGIGTFTVPDNVTRIMIEVWGGGGGGGGGGNGSSNATGGNGGGGGGGGYGKDVLTVSPGDNLAVTVGLGGAAGGTGAGGIDGGASSVGSVSATGGGGGAGGGAAGNFTNGTAGNGGNPGTSTAAISINGVQGGGGSVQGGSLPGGAGAIGGAGGLGSVVGGLSGSVQFGQTPGGGGSSGPGQNGTGTPGNGGAAGRVIIWW